jgi:hypothetical protein
MNRKAKGYKIGKVLSRIFDVPIAGFILSLFVLDKGGEISQLSGLEIVVAVFYLLIIPVLVILLLIKIGKLDNWELTNRSSRKYAYFLGFGVFSVLTLISIATGTPEYYTNYLYFGLIVLVIYGIITNYTKYKLSIHVGVWTSVSLLAMTQYSIKLGFIFLPILCITAVARYLIKNHTSTEIFLGGMFILIIQTIFTITYL